MGISLYTSRVILNALGVEDFGIYNLVGGMVTLFTFVNAAMLAATQRFLNYEMGHGTPQNMSDIFHTAYIIHFILAIIIILLCETIGLWMLYHKLQIPIDRLNTAVFVFHVSVCTCALQVITLPYNAVIIAHERMNIYAYISILDGGLKLLTCFLLTFLSGDLLKLYAILVAGIQCIISCIYIYYCRSHFCEVTGKLRFNKPLFNKMASFSGWCMVGCTAGMMYSQGLNLLLGIFFSPVVNAARGIAVQAQGAVTSFITNIQTATTPQIIQSYSAKNYDYFFSLVFKSSKYTTFLVLILAIPIFIRTPYILSLWLGEYPHYTAPFIRILLCVSIIDAMSFALMRASDATGDIKKYHSVVGGILLTIVPIAYIVLKLGGTPISVFIVYLCVSIIALCSRLVILRQKILLSIRGYITQVVLRIMPVMLLSSVVCYIVSEIINDNLGGFILFCFISALVTTICIICVGMTHKERGIIKSKLRKYQHKR